LDQEKDETKGDTAARPDSGTGEAVSKAASFAEKINRIVRVLGGHRQPDKFKDIGSLVPEARYTGTTTISPGAATKPTTSKNDKIHLARRSYLLRSDGGSALPAGSDSIYELSPPHQTPWI
jgi:hypothetical protein